MWHRLPPPSIALSRRGRLLLGVCLIALVTLWSCRLPKLCTFGQCNGDITTGPVAHGQVDLSLPDAPFIGWPLARVCNETEWVPGLVFVCDNNSGGVGNIRNYILTCVRYAVAAGAAGLVVPQIETRSPENLAHLFRGYQPLDYFFDARHFRAALATACPQLTLWDAPEAVPNLGDARPEKITPRHYGARADCDQRDLNRHTDAFGPRFRTWLASTADEFGLPPVGSAHPRLIRFNWGVQWDWPVWKDGPEFASTFGGLLRFRPDVLDLAKRTAAAMRKFAASSRGGKGGGRFASFHLRTEHDALASWPTFDVQSAAFLREAEARQFRAAYLATGNTTEAAKLVAEASLKQGLHVVTKHKLLADRPDDLKRLESLTWDQQALVDFAVLLYSDYFVGVSPSSFSINVAGKRHLKAEGLYTRPWKVGREGDGRSYLVGKYESYWDDWLFMFDSLWP